MKPAHDEQPDRDARWDAATWEGARRDHLVLSLQATPQQRLAWLEEAIELARAAGALRRADEPPPE